MAQRYKIEDSQCFKSKGAEEGRLDKFVKDCYASYRSGIGAQAVFAHTHGRDLAAELLAQDKEKSKLSNQFYMKIKKLFS